MLTCPVTEMFAAAVYDNEEPVPKLLEKSPLIRKAVAGIVLTTAPDEAIKLRLP